MLVLEIESEAVTTVFCETEADRRNLNLKETPNSPEKVGNRDEGKGFLQIPTLQILIHKDMIYEETN